MMSGQPVEDAAPLTASLLSLPTENRLAEQKPVFFVFEDAYWIDPTTLELLELTVERVPETAVLMLITYRSELDELS